MTKKTYLIRDDQLEDLITKLKSKGADNVEVKEILLLNFKGHRPNDENKYNYSPWLNQENVKSTIHIVMSNHREKPEVITALAQLLYFREISWLKNLFIVYSDFFMDMLSKSPEELFEYSDLYGFELLDVIKDYLEYGKNIPTNTLNQYLEKIEKIKQFYIDLDEKQVETNNLMYLKSEMKNIFEPTFNN